MILQGDIYQYALHRDRMDTLFQKTRKTANKAACRRLKTGNLSASLVIGLGLAFTLSACQLTKTMNTGLHNPVAQSDAAPNGSRLANSLVRSENPLNNTPKDPQEQIGAREHPLVLAKYGGEYHNGAVEKLLAVIIGRLVAVSDQQHRTFRVTILNSPKVNAFALPGGYLYVTRGLLALANDTSQLAAVLAHEMAHISSNHAMARIERQNSANLGQQVASEVLGGSMAGKIALAANRIRLNNFSQAQELQADDIGIHLLGKAGYDAHGAAKFLKTLQAYQAMKNSSNEALGGLGILSSHPATAERVELAKRHARAFGAPGLGEADRNAYLGAIDGLLFGDSAQEGFVRGKRFSHRGLGITFSAPKNTKIENQSTAVIINGPNAIATRFDAAVLPFGKDLEAYVKSGWVRGLEQNSIAATQYNGLPGLSAKASGGRWNFAIRLVQIDRQVYRFITAGPKTDRSGVNHQINAVSEAIVGSFRQMSQVEKNQLRSLNIRTVTVRPGDTSTLLAAKMRTGGNNLRLFEIINGLESGQSLKPGDQVKIITDQ